jgi:hypothetical protein
MTWIESKLRDCSLRVQFYIHKNKIDTLTLRKGPASTRVGAFRAIFCGGFKTEHEKYRLYYQNSMI